MATDEQKTKAREMGWFDRDQFRGDVKDFIDADEFLSRGEKLVPILKANNRKLNETVKKQGSQIQQLSTQLQQAQAAIQEFHTQGLQGRLDRLKAEKQRVLAEKTAAIQAEDAAGQTQADDRLVQLNGEISEAEKAVGSAKSTNTPPNAQPNAAQNQQAYDAWIAANSWYGEDQRKTRYANGVAQEIRANPANANLVGEAFYKKVSEEVDLAFPKSKQSVGKTEPGGNGSGNGGGGSGGGSGSDHSYSDLPADAKAVCDRDAKNPRIVGKGKLYETAEAYREHYVSHYDWS